MWMINTVFARNCAPIFVLRHVWLKLKIVHLVYSVSVKKYNLIMLNLTHVLIVNYLRLLKAKNILNEISKLI